MASGSRRAKVRTDKREALLDALADAVLANGLDAASLRPLAKAVGTSDRMLLYYFADKTALLTATFDRVLARLMPLLLPLYPVRRPLPVQGQQQHRLQQRREGAALGEDLPAELH
ncbi:MAG: TetR family transcriptional regulator, partial [Pseudomonadota bacterium]